MIPAIIPATKNSSKLPKSEIPAKTIAAKPAAGPDTEMFELLNTPITRPPIIPEIMPDNGGAPEASAIPKHKGSATKNTTNPDGRFCFISAIND